MDRKKVELSEYLPNGHKVVSAKKLPEPLCNVPFMAYLEMRTDKINYAIDYEGTNYFDNKILYPPPEVARRFHSSTKRCKLMVGGIRGTKTFSDVNEMLEIAAGIHPEWNAHHIIPVPNRGYYCTVDWPKIEEIFLPEVLLLAGAWADDKCVDRKNHIITWQNGGTMSFKSYQSDPKSFAAATLSYGVVDEEPPKDKWDELNSRVGQDYLRIFGGFLPEKYLSGDENYAYLLNIIENVPEHIDIFKTGIDENPSLLREAVEDQKKQFHGIDAEVRLYGALKSLVGRQRFDNDILRRWLLKSAEEYKEAV